MFILSFVSSKCGEYDQGLSWSSTYNGGGRDTCYRERFWANFLARSDKNIAYSRFTEPQKYGPDGGRTISAPMAKMVHFMRSRTSLVGQENPSASLEMRPLQPPRDLRLHRGQVRGASA